MSKVGMFSMLGLSDTNREVSPCSLGRGRGWFLNHAGRSETTPIARQPEPVPVANSTPASDSSYNPVQVITVDAMGSIIADLAKQIGESVTANLSTLNHHSSGLSKSLGVSQTPGRHDASELRVVVQPSSDLPPFYRGDGSDKFTIHEWKEMMERYAAKMSYDTHGEMYDFVMSRLTCKARDVVKVSLRSSADLEPEELAATVFDILVRNFSDIAYSNMPMRDFYSTVPKPGESALDYWIRLNKMIDAVGECLRRRGKHIEDPNAEVVLMFISHCPDPELEMSFKFKPAEKWTAAEVQERLDSHVSYLKGANAKAHRSQSMSVYGQCVVVPVPPSHECELGPTPSNTGGTYFNSPNTHVNSSVQPVSSSARPLAAMAPVVPHSAVQSPNAYSSDSGLSQLVAVLDKALTICSAESQSLPAMGFHRSRCQKDVTSTTCRVCSARDHSTYAHCKRDKLCRHCLKPGHFRSQCPSLLPSQSRSVGLSSSTPALN
ncbi:uncharacterized protein LOC125728344 [Brienomyrus brachyistius]|uniref:uncharacterized protein LOC125728344 n=1 Tax=Brienomyrus brachyistius TaxID=42636 RepID=UPI0020B3D680|nr:uncharacterized protein LOC125728344 [Brienomyrus brachyistius]